MEDFGLSNQEMKKFFANANASANEFKETLDSLDNNPAASYSFSNIRLGQYRDMISDVVEIGNEVFDITRTEYPDYPVINGDDPDFPPAPTYEPTPTPTPTPDTSSISELFNQLEQVMNQIRSTNNFVNTIVNAVLGNTNSSTGSVNQPTAVPEPTDVPEPTQEPVPAGPTDLEKLDEAIAGYTNENDYNHYTGFHNNPNTDHTEEGVANHRNSVQNKFEQLLDRIADSLRQAGLNRSWINQTKRDLLNKYSDIIQNRNSYRDNCIAINYSDNSISTSLNIIINEKAVAQKFKNEYLTYDPCNGTGVEPETPEGTETERLNGAIAGYTNENDHNHYTGFHNNPNTDHTEQGVANHRNSVQDKFEQLLDRIADSLRQAGLNRSWINESKRNLFDKYSDIIQNRNSYRDNCITINYSDNSISTSLNITINEKAVAQEFKDEYLSFVS